MHSFRQPSYFSCFSYIEFRHIGLDIQEGGSIYDVQILYVKDVPFHPDKTRHGDADGIWPARAAHGEDSVRLVIHIGLGQQRCALRQMEVVDQDDMREAVNIFQAFRIFREYFNRPGDALATFGLNRRSFGLFERRMNDSDRFVLYLIHGSYCSLSEENGATRRRAQVPRATIKFPRQGAPNWR